MTESEAEVHEFPPFRTVQGTVAVPDLDEFLDDVRAIREETNAVVQVLDARYVASEAHLRRSVELSARSIARGEAVARDPAVELLLYAAGRRQIDRALEMGVEEQGGDQEPDGGSGASPAIAVIADFSGVDGAGLSHADLQTAVDRVAARFESIGVEHRDEELIREYFSITDAELSATDGTIDDLVCERVALLDVEK